MKLPAVALALAFAGGILLGLVIGPRFAAPTKPFLFCSLALSLAVFLLSLATILTKRLPFAAALCLLTWMMLGFMALSISTRPLPARHILTRIDSGQVELTTPLRWYGRLRDEPAKLPWGWAFDMGLDAVDFEGQTLPLAGGMRVGFTPSENDPDLPGIHAGDRISVLAQARLPLRFSDPGAFDRREFLAKQNIHLLATLRATSLLEKQGSHRWQRGNPFRALPWTAADPVDASYFPHPLKPPASCARCFWAIARFWTEPNR